MIDEKDKVWVLGQKVFRQIMVDIGDKLLRNKLKCVQLLLKFDTESFVKMSNFLFVVRLHRLLIVILVEKINLKKYIIQNNYNNLIILLKNTNHAYIFTSMTAFHFNIICNVVLSFFFIY